MSDTLLKPGKYQAEEVIIHEDDTATVVLTRRGKRVELSAAFLLTNSLVLRPDGEADLWVSIIPEGDYELPAAFEVVGILIRHGLSSMVVRL